MKWLLIITYLFIFRVETSAQSLPIVDLNLTQNPNQESDKLNLIGSSVFGPNSELYKFNTGGVILDSSYTWRINQEFPAYELIYRHVFTSDDQGNRLTFLSTVRVGSQWVNAALYSYAYDGNNNVVHQLTQAYNGSGWDNDFQIIYTYNSNNDQLSRVTQDWDGTAWVNSDQHVSTFDDHHHELTQLYTLWDGTNWYNVSLRNYTYDMDGRRINELIRNWIGDWINHQQVDYTYDALDNLDTTFHQIWMTDHWVDDFRMIYTYDSYNNLQNVVTQQSDGGNQWQDDSRVVYTYDAYQQITTWISQIFINGEWKNFYQLSYIYDEAGNLFSQVYQVWQDELTGKDSTRYFYSFPSGVKDPLHQNTLTISPNPAQETISIQTNNQVSENMTISVYSQAGVKVMEKNINAQPISTIDISKLPPGAYHILVQHDQSIESRKFLKF